MIHAPLNKSDKLHEPDMRRVGVEVEMCVGHDQPVIIGIQKNRDAAIGTAPTAVESSSAEQTSGYTHRGGEGAEKERAEEDERRDEEGGSTHHV